MLFADKGHWFKIPNWHLDLAHKLGHVLYKIMQILALIDIEQL